MYTVSIAGTDGLKIRVEFNDHAHALRSLANAVSAVYRDMGWPSTPSTNAIGAPARKGKK